MDGVHPTLSDVPLVLPLLPFTALPSISVHAWDIIRSSARRLRRIERAEEGDELTPTRLTVVADCTDCDLRWYPER